MREQVSRYLREELQNGCKDMVKIKMEPEDNQNNTVEEEQEASNQKHKVT